ncbi:hypothetical protein [Vibrio sp. TBV020]|uniref:hypothetical protein n=1 Tax=Vibrio sp. TBV020 TaxID=3137398 RepID=UPI0038CD3A0D
MIIKYIPAVVLTLISTNILASPPPNVLISAPNMFDVPPSPPGSGVDSVTIRTTSGRSDTTIYANGRMQAAVNITYELADGYTVTDISVREAYTERELPSHWNVSNSSNGYAHDIDGTLGSPGNFSYGDPDKQTTTLFLSTGVLNDRTICAEVTASNGNRYSTLSTCSGDTNNGLVYIDTIPERQYSISDFDQTTPINTWYDLNGNPSSPWGHYAATYTKLTPKSSSNIIIKSIDAGTNMQDDGRRILIGSKLPKDKKDSALYVLYPNRNQTNNYAYSTGYRWAVTRSFPVNTANAIVFAELRGVQSKRDKVYVNILMNWETLQRNISFYDIYGNKGHINIARKNVNDGYGNMYYRFY